MQAGLVSLLGSQSSITTYVKHSTPSGIRTAIFCNFAPQWVRDLHEISDKKHGAHILITQMGTNETPDLTATGPLRFVEFDIDVYSHQFPVSLALSDIVRQFLDDYTGTAGSETIKAIVMNGTRSDFVPPVDGSQNVWHLFTTNCDVQYTE